MKWLIGWLIMLGLLIGLSIPTYASWFQYEIVTLQVVGRFEAQEDSRPLDGTALMEIPGSNVPFPIPSGCTVGRTDWTLVSSGGVAPLVVNPALTFFRCQVVDSLAELNAVLQTETDRLTTAVEKIEGRVRMIAILTAGEVQCNCTSITGGQCDAGTNAPCVNLRANNNTIFAKIGTIPELVTYQEAIIQLHIDKCALQASKGWGACP